ncbi:MAG TPA: ABC transporter substrate-binding protein [Beijerinckiaceae bacterium]
MRRRTFIAAVAGAAAWPLAGRTQQSASVPVIGLLSSVPFDARRDQLAGFRQGLNEAGLIEGQNVRVEYRSAENQPDRLPALATGLVENGVAVIVTIGGDIPILAARSATASIPIVFVTGGDPVESGFVASLHRPGGNLTGVTFLPTLLVGKRVELMHAFVPSGTLGFLVNPRNPNVQSSKTDARAAAQALGRKLSIAEAATEGQIEDAFAALAGEKVSALVVEADPFFLAGHKVIVALAMREKLPAIYAFREFVDAGGLTSYGTSLAEAYRQAAAYAGRIVKGEKPGDLPVVQPVKFDFVINLKTARALSLMIPPTLIARADEVIE